MDETADVSRSSEKDANGQIRAEIARRMVQLHKEFYGKGPTKAKTFVFEDTVLVLLRGGFTRVEETLLREGRGAAVIQQRMEFQDVMRDRFTDLIEEVTGRTVIAFMSGNHQDPDILAEVFVLAPTDLLDDDDTERATGGAVS